MARWQLTIRQPVGSTPAIPTLTVENFSEKGYSTGYIEQIELDSLTIGQAGIYKGNTVGWRRTWNIVAIDVESFLDRFNAMMRWQSTRILAGLDGRLEIIDEIEYTMPEPTGTTTKTYLAGSTVSPFSGYTKGFGIFKVIILPGQEHGLQVGQGVGGSENLKYISFSAVEVPNS